MKEMLVLVVAATAAIALIGCQSDADRIREQNRTDAAAATATAAPTATATPLRAKIRSDEIEVGDCLDSALPEGITIESVVIVPCSGSWQYRVRSTFEARDGTWPDVSGFAHLAFHECGPRSSYFLYPLDEGWSIGDRTVLCLQQSFGLSVTDPVKLDRLLTFQSLNVGDCFNLATETDGALAERVDCSGHWTYRALSMFMAQPSSYPGEAVFGQAAREQCGPRHSYTLFPLPEHWEIGYRNVICLQQSFGISATDPAKLDRLVALRSLPPTGCFNEAPETDGLLVESVPCDGEWESRVVSTFSIGSEESLPSDAYFQRAAFERCDARYSNYYSPSTHTWALGHRDVTCIQDSFGLSVTDPANLDRLVDINSLGAGDCFNEAPETEESLVETVPCDDGWEQQVVGVFLVADVEQYPGEAYVEEQASQLCPDEADQYYSPNESTWELGDRQVICIRKS